MYYLDLACPAVPLVVQRYKIYYPLVYKYIVDPSVLYICILDLYNLLQLR